MTLERALSKLESNGFHHDIQGQEGTAYRPQSSSDSIIKFMLTDGRDSKDKEVISVRVVDKNEKDDVERKRYPGKWVSNISQAIRTIDVEEMMKGVAKSNTTS